MQKLTRIMAIVATGLMALSLVLLLASMVLQPVVVDLMGYHPAVMEHLPVIPVTELVFGFLQMLCVGLLIICCGNKKGGPWLELAVIVILVAVLPLLNWVASGFVTRFVNAAVFHYSGPEMGAYHSLARTISQLLAGYCLVPAGLGKIIGYVACGMSIAFKHMSKKLDRVTQQ